MCISLPTTPKSPQPTRAPAPIDKTTSPQHSNTNNEEILSNTQRITHPNIHRSSQSSSHSHLHSHANNTNTNKVIYRNIDEDIMHSSVSAFAPGYQRSSMRVAARREEVKVKSVVDEGERSSVGVQAQRQVDRRGGGEQGTKDMRCGGDVESRV